MHIFLLVLHVMAALGIIGLVLLQHGKGADVGAAFGSGSAGSVFGAAGSANFLSRATAILALVFFLTSMSLTYFTSRKADTEGVMSGVNAPAQSVPGQPAGQVPGQPAGQAKAPAKPATPSPAAPAERGKVEEVPK